MNYRWLFALLLATTVHCGSGASTVDAGSDAVSEPSVGDGSVDVAGDLIADAAVDVLADNSSDATSNDAASDLGTDTATETGADVAPDVTTDTLADTATEAAADSGDGETCSRPTTDLSARDSDCSGGRGCPSGYTCHPFEGVVLGMMCEILCVSDCDCPSGSTCQTREDKSGRWMQCD